MSLCVVRMNWLRICQTAAWWWWINICSIHIVSDHCKMFFFFFMLFPVPSWSHEAGRKQTNTTTFNFCCGRRKREKNLRHYTFHCPMMMIMAAMSMQANVSKKNNKIRVEYDVYASKSSNAIPTNLMRKSILFLSVCDGTQTFQMHTHTHKWARA